MVLIGTLSSFTVDQVTQLRVAYRFPEYLLVTASGSTDLNYLEYYSTFKIEFSMHVTAFL
jgi:hypothetical protein